MLSTKRPLQICILIFIICMGKSIWGLTPAQRAELAYQEGKRQELAREHDRPIVQRIERGS